MIKKQSYMNKKEDEIDENRSINTKEMKGQKIKKNESLSVVK